MVSLKGLTYLILLILKMWPRRNECIRKRKIAALVAKFSCVNVRYYFFYTPFTWSATRDDFTCLTQKKKKTCEQVSLTEKHVCFRIRFGSRVCKVTQNLGCHSPFCLFFVCFFLHTDVDWKNKFMLSSSAHIGRRPFIQFTLSGIVRLATSAIPYLSLIPTLAVLFKVKLLDS